MLIFALALAAPMSFTQAHERDIACVVEIAVVADAQRRGLAHASGLSDVRQSGRRWAGIVGARITQESGQPRELVAFAMNEAAKARQARADGDVPVVVCAMRMAADLAATDAIDAPLPKPKKPQ